MSERLPTRLSWKLLAAILPSVVIAVSAVAWLEYAAARRQILGGINREVQFLSQRAAREIDDVERRRRQDLLTLSDTPLIADYYHNVDFGLLDEAESYRKELERYLLDFARRSRDYLEVVYIGASGQEAVRVSRGQAAPRRDARAAPYFARARRMAAGEWWCSDIVEDPNVGTAQYWVRSARDEVGEFKGALVLVFDFHRVEDILREGVAPGERARAYIRTADWTFPRVAPGGREMLSAQTDLWERPWTVFVEVPVESALAPLKTVKRAAFLTALVGLAALVLTIFLWVRSVTGPVARLAAAARRLGEGDLSHRVLVTSSDEIGALSRAFNEMAARLDADQRRQKELQQQLIQAEKISAAGLLLSSVAHELSNPLAIVAGHAQLLNYRDFPKAVHAILDQIRESAMRCGNIVKNMLLFVRSSCDTRKPVKMGVVVESALGLLRYRLTRGSDVDVALDVPSDLPEIAGDFQQLSQVLVNLITNARDAMETVDPRRRKRKLLIRCRADAQRLTVEVQDNGPGIDPELGRKIFEPFVTTKEPGRGTGLGLYICRQIAEAHLGKLTYESRLDEGAAFLLSLPVQAGARINTPVRVFEPLPVPGKRVLVVDDEPGVGDVIAHALSEEGDEVTVTDRGADALARIEKGRFDLVISDIEMEGVKGYEIYELARSAFAPPIPVLIVTGNSLDRRVHKFFEETGVPYVVKPFDTAFLRRAVRRILAGRAVTGLQAE